MPSNQHPLADVRVVEFGHVATGPQASAAGLVQQVPDQARPSLQACIVAYRSALRAQE